MMIRELFCKRPLIIAFFFYLVTGFFVLYCRMTSFVPLIVTAALLCALFVIGILHIKKKLPLAPFLALFLLLALLLLPFSVGIGLNRRRANMEERYQNTVTDAILTVESVTAYDSVTLAYGRIAVADESLRASVLVFEKTVIEQDGESRTLQRGDRLFGSFSLSAESGKTLSELSAYANGYELSGILLTGGEILASESVPPSVRERLSVLIDEKLSHYGSGMIKALLLADKSGISDEVRANFSNLGISHLLAVSGLHLTVLVGAIAYLLRRTSLKKAILHPILALLILFYLVLTDFAPSLLRAGGMLVLFYLSGYVRRRRDTLLSLFTAASLITLIDPKAILDIGFLLSVLSTLGIIVLASPLLTILKKSPRLSGECLGKRLLRLLLDTSLITLSATTFILPVLFLLTGDLFLLAPLSNLLFTGFITALLYLLPLFLVTLPIPVLSSVVAFFVELLAMILSSLSYLAPITKPFLISLGYRFMPYLFVILALLALFFFLKRKRLLALAVLASFLILSPIGILIDNAYIKTTEAVGYYSDGKNDLVFLEKGLNRVAVVFSSSQGFVTKALTNERLSSPSVVTDTLFLTDADPAFALTVYSLWENGELTHLILPKIEGKSDYLAGFAKSLGMTVTLYTPNDTLSYNGIEIVTHADTKGKTAAITTRIKDRSLLYLKEDAPNDFDIRFGVLTKAYDTVILGTHGNEMKGSLSLSADEVWEYERRSYILPKKDTKYREGNALIREKNSSK